MTSTERPDSDNRVCEFCGEDISRKSYKRHVKRKHDGEQPAAVVEDEHTITGTFLATGEQVTGRVIEMTAQDFKRGSWDYFLIETEDGDKVIVQTERAA
ncbi:MAG: hypothetical protein EKK42_20090 [Pseudonocardiaceae bacterium]|nr:MAG: hypothetical protein EKK42_20090 [Pseudonocardiaceae bacterium]